MDTIAKVRVMVSGESEFDASISEPVARLRALGHRIESYTLREYRFPDDVKAQAAGTSRPIVAWSETEIPDTGSPEIGLVRRRPVPVPYLDWSMATVDHDELVVDVFVTHKMHFKVARDGVTVEIAVGQDIETHMSAAIAVCESCGFDTPRPDASALLREACARS